MPVVMTAVATFVVQEAVSALIGEVVSESWGHLFGSSDDTQPEASSQEQIDAITAVGAKIDGLTSELQKTTDRLDASLQKIDRTLKATSWKDEFDDHVLPLLAQVETLDEVVRQVAQGLQDPSEFTSLLQHASSPTHRPETNLITLAVNLRAAFFEGHVVDARADSLVARLIAGKPSSAMTSELLTAATSELLRSHLVVIDTLLRQHAYVVMASGQDDQDVKRDSMVRHATEISKMEPIFFRALGTVVDAWRRALFGDDGVVPVAGRAGLDPLDVLALSSCNLAGPKALNGNGGAGQLHDRFRTVESVLKPFARPFPDQGRTAVYVLGLGVAPLGPSGKRAFQPALAQRETGGENRPFRPGGEFTSKTPGRPPVEQGIARFVCDFEIPAGVALADLLGSIGVMPHVNYNLIFEADGYGYHVAAAGGRYVPFAPQDFEPYIEQPEGNVATLASAGLYLYVETRATPKLDINLNLDIPTSGGPGFNFTAPTINIGSIGGFGL